jgi:hypothetical protein
VRKEGEGLGRVCSRDKNKGRGEGIGREEEEGGEQEFRREKGGRRVKGEEGGRRVKVEGSWLREKRVEGREGGGSMEGREGGRENNRGEKETEGVICLHRALEVILISMATTSTVFIVAMLLGTCLQSTNLDATSNNSSDAETRDFFCPSHNDKETHHKSYYNDMATLMFNSQETAIKQLFHQDGKSM